MCPTAEERGVIRERCERIGDFLLAGRQGSGTGLQYRDGSGCGESANVGAGAAIGHGAGGEAGRGGVTPHGGSASCYHRNSEERAFRRLA